ncbi:hypothetical protein HFO68_32410 [Rhizobium laguerreae]|uniref:hypothetical protein n=1 Tax=Rhizobium laguerreae TaxID=1076926 RepID=UPI001C8FEECE|nr:hypothetical protein [Rhizobium laguerreae]MBY3095635.1 hypothetical protein [Rhizobium laguerreae]MBY3102846.1 hypothetical protein [Rhizobium laguerreae]MBY3109208.1 hypothetical protein [Rhizobium laguerreae]MBY3129993.1 hypothetical protein [Rhizobium laguerreae]MBY3143793.1 hypothetical protein [Rhizobium laguerreae]
MDIMPAVVIAGIVENERQHGQARGSITLRIVNQELRAFMSSQMRFKNLSLRASRKRYNQAVND